MKKTYIPREMFGGHSVDIYSTCVRYLCPGLYVRHISFFGFQLRTTINNIMSNTFSQVAEHVFGRTPVKTSSKTKTFPQKYVKH